GGTPIALCDAPFGRGASWGEDGAIVASLKLSGGLWRIPAAGGAPQPVTETDGVTRDATHRWPQILRRGKALLFTAHTTPTDMDAARIELLTLPDGRRKTVHKGGSFGRYLPSGHILYVNKGTVFALPFDLGRGEVTGAP